MKTSTAQRRNGIQWTPWTHLDDLDFSDDLALISHTQRQMREKTNTAADNSARLGLRVHTGKSKVLKNNAAVSTEPTTLESRSIRRRDKFHLPR